MYTYAPLQCTHSIYGNTCHKKCPPLSLWGSHSAPTRAASSAYWLIPQAVKATKEGIALDLAPAAVFKGSFSEDVH